MKKIKSNIVFQIVAAVIVTVFLAACDSGKPEKTEVNTPVMNEGFQNYVETGDLLHQGHAIFHCDRFGNKILLHEVRTEIVEYIKQQCIGCEIVVAFSRNSRIYIGVLNGDARKIMVFNQAGDFLFSRR